MQQPPKAAIPETEREWLLKEAEHAATLTFHIDELRNRLTSFYVGLAGVLITAISVLVGDGSKTSLVVPAELATFLLMFLAGIGVIVLRILARLRRVQLEHFAVLQNIRSLFLDKDWQSQVLGLSAETLPDARDRWSGTYFWTLLIILMAAASASASAFTYMTQVWAKLPVDCGVLVSTGVFALACLVLDEWWMASLGHDSPAEQIARPTS